MVPVFSVSERSRSGEALRMRIRKDRLAGQVILLLKYRLLLPRSRRGEVFPAPIAGRIRQRAGAADQRLPSLVRGRPIPYAGMLEIAPMRRRRPSTPEAGENGAATTTNVVKPDSVQPVQAGGSSRGPIRRGPTPSRLVNSPRRGRETERLRFRREAAVRHRRGSNLHRIGALRPRPGGRPRRISGKEPSSAFVDDLSQPALKSMRDPLLDFVEHGSFFPHFQPDFIGFRKILGEHLLHFRGEFLVQNHRVHLVVGGKTPEVHVGGADGRPDVVDYRGFRMQHDIAAPV